MKAILIFFLTVLACSAYVQEIELSQLSSVAPNPEDFIRGFLEAIHEKKGVEDLKKCMTKMEPIFEKVKKALELFLKLTFPDIVEGLKLLKEAFDELKKMLEPCLEGFTQLQLLLKKIKEASLVNLAYKILANAKTFIKDITDCIEAFKKLDLYTAGKCIGDIMLKLFLERGYNVNPLQLFIEGLLLGIKEEHTIEDLLKCIKNSEQILAKIQKAIELISKFTLESLLEGLSLLFEAIKDIHEMLEPCLGNFPQFKKLIEAIIKSEINKIIAKILANPFGYITIVVDCYKAFIAGDFKRAGKDIGEILFKLFLETMMEPDQLDVLAFMRGFIDGLNEKGHVEDLKNCMNGLERIIPQIIEAIKKLQHIDFQHLPDIIQGIMMLIQAVTDLLKILKPCSASLPQLKRLLDIISHGVDFTKLALKLVSNPGLYIGLVMSAIDAFNKGEWERAGKAIGSILFNLFLTRRFEEAPFDIMKFLTGFLKGLNEKGDIGELVKCASGLEKIVPKIIEAINYLKHLDFEHMADIIKGLTLLFQAITEFLQILQPCMKGFEQLKRLFDALQHLDIMKILMKILTNPAPIIQDVMDCIDAFQKEDWEKAGRCIGDLLYRIFLCDRF